MLKTALTVWHHHLARFTVSLYFIVHFTASLGGHQTPGSNARSHPVCPWSTQPLTFILLLTPGQQQPSWKCGQRRVTTSSASAVNASHTLPNIRRKEYETSAAQHPKTWQGISIDYQPQHTMPFRQSVPFTIPPLPSRSPTQASRALQPPSTLH
ncbi:hypothetical protein E2C01_065822 [Portunus trituberculatus]|uniref:Secreted protein n=1 Tax=Portunus trituberculatus TaxID=210409 RepID=A0A5B7HSW0_PORTR|nr:hypothetical protein [Portunus trituberculatus]